MQIRPIILAQKYYQYNEFLSSTQFASDIDDIKLGSVKDKVGSWTSGKGSELQPGSSQIRPINAIETESNKRIQGPAAGPGIVRYTP